MPPTPKLTSMIKNKYAPFVWTVNLKLENTMIEIPTIERTTVLYPVLRKNKLQKNLDTPLTAYPNTPTKVKNLSSLISFLT